MSAPSLHVQHTWRGCCVVWRYRIDSHVLHDIYIHLRKVVFIGNNLTYLQWRNCVLRRPGWLEPNLEHHRIYEWLVTSEWLELNLENHCIYEWLVTLSRSPRGRKPAESTDASFYFHGIEFPPALGSASMLWVNRSPYWKLKESTQMRTLEKQIIMWTSVLKTIMRF